MAEERVKPRSLYVEEAIQAALESRWSEALAINQALIERHGPDEDTHNRLGKSLTELGRLDEALGAYSDALRMNPLNPIAQKNVRKLSTMLEQKERVSGSAAAIDVDLFTEEPGKSALTVLRPPGRDAAVSVAPGDVVELIPQDGQLLAHTTRGVAIGEVEPKLSRRLLPLIQTGNRYTAAVARVDEQAIEIIVREVYQAAENSRKASFPLARGARREEFRPYTKDALLSSREIDATPLMADDDEEPFAEAVDDGEDEMAGMGVTTLDEDAGDSAAADTEDDEESRPEDEY